MSKAPSGGAGSDEMEGDTGSDTLDSVDGVVNSDFLDGVQTLTLAIVTQTPKSTVSSEREGNLN
jgi:hypothetical protein